MTDHRSALRVVVDDLSGSAVQEFLAQHLRDMHDNTPPESVHALDLEALRRPGITFWSVWDGDDLVGCGALKDLGGGHAELKSMRTDASRRRRGVATHLLAHIEDHARATRVRRISLETGSGDAHAAARALYARHGFDVCEPFADYAPDPLSAFMTKAIAVEDGGL